MYIVAFNNYILSIPENNFQTGTVLVRLPWHPLHVSHILAENLCRLNLLVPINPLDQPRISTLRYETDISNEYAVQPNNCLSISKSSLSTVFRK